MKKNTRKMAKPHAEPISKREWAALRTASDQEKVVVCLSELLHNPETPQGLWNHVSEFVTEQSNECDEGLYQSDFYLTEIMKSVKPEERMGAAHAAREAK